MSLSLDHVIFCLPDLERSVAVFEEEHGVASVPGGRHSGHGTANRLIPLGSNYIELVAVVDEAEAVGSDFGSWVLERSSFRSADAIALRTDDLDAICERLDLEPVGMSRPSGTGDQLTWRIAGMEQMVTEGLPFFIQWDVGPRFHPGRITASHPVGDVTVSGVTVIGDAERLRSWIGDVEGIEIEEGDRGVDFSWHRARKGAMPGFQ